jgi:modification methylase
LNIKIFNKDSTEDMREIGTGTVDLIITSPPYWNIVDYKNPKQLGKNISYKYFIYQLKKTLYECMRILKEDSFICLIVGDVRTGEYKNNGRPRIYSLQSNLIEIFTEEMDFDLFQHFIWEKFGVKKGEKASLIYGSVCRGDYKEFAVPPLLYTDMLTEHILVFRKPGKHDRGKVEDRQKENLNLINKSDLETWLSPVWKIHSNTNPSHPATFPDELVIRLIKLYSLADDLIVDPFAGTGTTLINADKLGRRAIGYEINPDYIELIENKMIIIE